MTYRLRCHWVDGKTTHTVLFTRKRDVQRAFRRFREVALITRVVIEAHEKPGEDWFDLYPVAA